MKKIKNKIKTKKAAAKRFSFTGTGKIKYKKAGKRHLLESKSPKQIRSKRNNGEVSKTDEAKLKAMLPGKL